jgi:hypothetical protein
MTKASPTLDGILTWSLVLAPSPPGSPQGFISQPMQAALGTELAVMSSQG